jgi:hypothetical protein
MQARPMLGITIGDLPSGEKPFLETAGPDKLLLDSPDFNDVRADSENHRRKRLSLRFAGIFDPQALPT